MLTLDYILLKNLRHVFAGGDNSKYLVPDEALKAFLHHCSETIGDAYFRTPRNTIKAFLDMLAVLEQNPAVDWSQLVSAVTVEKDCPSDMEIDIAEDDKIESDGLTDFKI